MEHCMEVQKVQDVTVIRLVFNEINLQQRQELKADLAKFLSEENKHYVIDLFRVGFVSSLVLALIVFFAKEVREAGGELKLSGLSEEATSIFRITKLDSAFELYETEHDAIESCKHIA